MRSRRRGRCASTSRVGRLEQVPGASDALRGSHLCGVVPTSWPNRRANVRSDMLARAARLGTEWSSSRCSDSQSRTSCRLSRGLGRHWGLDVLALSTCAVRGHDHAACDPVGHVGAELLGDQVEAGVDPCRRPRAGEDRTVLDIDRIDVDPGLREALPEQLGVSPVGPAVASVEQARLAEPEGATAHREHAGAAVHGVPEDLERLRPERSVHRATRNGNEIRISSRLERVRRDDPHPGLRGEHPGRVDGTDPEVERRHSVLGPIDPEDLAEDGELERCDGFLEEDGDGAEHVLSVAQSWQKMNVHRQFCHSWR